MVADNCWEEYIWKVHHAIPIDPWQSTFQLLDVLIDDEFADDSLRTGFAARLLRAFRRKRSVRRSFASGKLRRVGTMLTVGDDSAGSWHQNVEMLISQGLKALSSENPNDERKVVINLGKSAGGQEDGEAENGPKSAEGGPAPADIDTKEGKSADGPKSAEGGPVPTDAKQEKSEDGPKSGANGPVPADAKQGKSADGGHKLDVAAAAAAKFMETSNPAANSLFAVRDLPDMMASVASTTSLLASLGLDIASNIVSGQFDDKKRRTAKCTFNGVRSHKVLEDALARLVGADGRNRTPDWKPAISNPLLRWSSKRRQRLWIVTEIMYANEIEVEDDVKKSGEARASVKKAEATAGDGDVTAKIGKDVMWKVSVPDKSKWMRFPFAFRMTRLDYDSNASLLLNSFLPQHLLSRSQSISNPNPNHAFHFR